MKHYSITNHHFTAKNGINKEQCLDYHYNGRHGNHDNLKWYEGSDIPEQKISVKSEKFSLTSGGQLKGDNLTEMLNDYFARVASVIFAYVTNDYQVYEMNATEFREFLENFTRLEKDSTKNGGKIKVRAKTESQEMLAWLYSRA